MTPQDFKARLDAALSERMLWRLGMVNDAAQKLAKRSSLEWQLEIMLRALVLLSHMKDKRLALPDYPRLPSTRH